FEVVTDLQGVVVSDEMVDLRPELGGRILRIHVKEGDEVQVGQKLVTLDGEQVRRAIEEAEKALELARTTYERQQALWDQKIGSEIQYLQAKNQKEQLELRLETLRNQLEKFVLTAPVRGTVDRLFMHVGDVAAPQAPILRIVNNSHVKVEADVPERYVGAFNKKSPVRLHFPAIGLSMEGIFRSIGQSIDPNNRTFLVVIEPQGPEKSRLLPNMLARVEVVLQARPQALVVPTQAIAFEDKGTYLWVCRQGKAFKVPVTVGATRGGESEIISGLQAGDLVVTEGYRNLRSGDPVQLVP
ncbi:MAG: efflux RND transporter periplasmic adaptor subunit, partial [Flavobacteriales bacterium]|nr:efflux RND transporter periplasmic adaptor subunit [Flavobacteriales bacterium]MDW8410092.1 efflux RND transporter periplasmic adaptor subunit [Flavobacteriales bacterium]